ncbi:MAG: UMP kinase [Spirochaetes bacterium]|nr:UMP kinase [Spirochaetota bacterium]
MADATVISLGGSLIAPDAVDTAFLASFHRLALGHLEADRRRKLIVICGGGGLARRYQAAFRELAPSASNDDLDWIGIAATRVNAELVRRMFGSLCGSGVLTDPTAARKFAGRVLVAAGWKPGFSTDNDAVILARRFAADTLVNLSNIAKVYTADPKKDPSARPLDTVSWPEFRKIVGEEWSPGRNTPFDPAATKAAAAARLRVIFADGRDLANLASILEGRPFIGTTIGPA